MNNPQKETRQISRPKILPNILTSNITKYPCKELRPKILPVNESRPTIQTNNLDKKNLTEYPDKILDKKP